MHQVDFLLLHKLMLFRLQPPHLGPLKVPPTETNMSCLKKTGPCPLHIHVKIGKNESKPVIFSLFISFTCVGYLIEYPKHVLTKK